MRGMFAVCKENILHIKKEIYTNLLESLSVGDNIENGHFAERIWAHLFRQYSFDLLKTERETEREIEPETEHGTEPFYLIKTEPTKPEGYVERICAMRNGY